MCGCVLQPKINSDGKNLPTIISSSISGPKLPNRCPKTAKRPHPLFQPNKHLQIISCFMLFCNFCSTKPFRFSTTWFFHLQMVHEVDLPPNGWPCLAAAAGQVPALSCGREVEDLAGGTRRRRGNRRLSLFTFDVHYMIFSFSFCSGQDLIVCQKFSQLM